VGAAAAVAVGPGAATLKDALGAAKTALVAAGCAAAAERAVVAVRVNDNPPVVITLSGAPAVCAAGEEVLCLHVTLPPQGCPLGHVEQAGTVRYTSALEPPEALPAETWTAPLGMYGATGAAHFSAQRMPTLAAQIAAQVKQGTLYDTVNTRKAARLLYMVSDFLLLERASAAALSFTPSLPSPPLPIFSLQTV
jgi:hypothetical protein